MSIARHLFSALRALASLSVAVGFAAGCGSNNDSGAAAAAAVDSSGGTFSMGDDGGDAAANLPRCIVATNQCVASCPGGGVDDRQRHRLRPGGEEPPLRDRRLRAEHPAGGHLAGRVAATRATASTSGNPIAYAVTDAAGKFTLTGVPDGANIPLVVQVGKWRMQYTLPT